MYRNEQYIASLYLAILLADTLFVDKSGMNCKSWVLGSIVHLDAARGYAWGAACLAFLYRELGNSFRVGAASLSGSSLLLRSWIWAYFPKFCEHTSIDPTARRDRRAAVRHGVKAPIKATADRLVGIRSLLDHYTCTEVIWMSWGQLDFASPTLSPSLFRGIIECMDVREPYMSGRVLRQFGCIQRIPLERIRPSVVVRPDQLHAKSKAVRYEDDACHWDNDPRPRIQLDERAAVTDPWDVDPAYMDWWMDYCHPYIDYRSNIPTQEPAAPVDAPPSPPPPRRQRT